MNPFEPPVLLLIAHWDDEILSAGGAMIRWGEGWDIVCATIRQQHAEFHGVFDRVCRTLRATPHTLPILQRTRACLPNEDRNEYCARAPHTELTGAVIRGHLLSAGLRAPKTVITHGADGDRGQHKQHKQLHKAAMDIFPDSSIWVIGYKSGEMQLDLTPEEYRMKLGLTRAYRRSWGADRSFPVEYFTKVR